MKEDFHERLKRLREAKGWSLSHLGKRSHLSETTLAALEADSHHAPGWITISKLSSALGTNPFYLASSDGDDKPFKVMYRRTDEVTATSRRH